MTSKPATPYSRVVGVKEKKLPLGIFRYLYQPGELEGGGRRRATDPVWSLKSYIIGRSVTKPDEPILYYLQDGPTRGFVQEELLLIPNDTVAPPNQLN